MGCKKMDMAQFGGKLKTLRKSRHISQDELGHVLGVSRATVGSWESARRNISIKHLESICDYFKVDINYFRENKTANEIIDLLERARLLFNNENLPLEEKQKLSEELMRLYLQMKEG